MTFTVDGTNGLTFPNATTQTTAGAKGVNVQTFNSSSTWTKPSGYATTARVFIQCWGGGGAGGSGGTSGTGSGGGGGAYNETWVNLSSMGATETITVGAGGASTTVTLTTNAGGDTSVGSFITAYGGGGGNGTVSNSDNYGGGGGGQNSAGVNGGNNTSNGYGGRPFLMSYPRLSGGTTQAPGSSAVLGNFGTQGRSGLYNSGQSAMVVYDSFTHGGGGGGVYGQCGAALTSTGANSIWGGAGGGSVNKNGTATSGGTSSFGGNGGSSGSTAGSAGTAGTAPGGGGGGSVVAAASGAGGAGRVVITVFDGA